MTSPETPIVKVMVMNPDLELLSVYVREGDVKDLPSADIAVEPLGTTVHHSDWMVFCVSREAE